MSYHFQHADYCFCNSGASEELYQIKEVVNSIQAEQHKIYKAQSKVDQGWFQCLCFHTDQRIKASVERIVQDTIDWLAPLDATNRLQICLEQRHEQTCGWLLEHEQFKGWKIGCMPFIWLNGMG